MYIWSWDWVWTYQSQLINAAWLTIWLNIAILIIGTIFGMLLGILKRSRLKLIRLSTVIFIDLVRTLPVLVLLIWFFFWCTYCVSNKDECNFNFIDYIVNESVCICC